MNMLAASILYHFLISIPLTALVWACGWVWLWLLGGSRDLNKCKEMLYAYPIGIVYISVIAALILSDTWLIWIGITGLIFPLVMIVLRPEYLPKNEIKTVFRSMASILPFALAFSFALAVKWHGPTAQLAGSPLEDIVFYVSRLHSLKVSLFPSYDLLVEGNKYGYANSAPALIGAVFTYFPGFDAFLFYAVTCPAFFLLSVCLGANLWTGYNTSLITKSRARIWLLTIFPLLVVASVAYPSWIVESPPVAFAIPMSFGLISLAYDAKISTAKFIVLATILLISTFLTKVFMIIPFVCVLGLSFVMNRWENIADKRMASLIILCASLILAAYTAYTLRSYQYMLKLLGLKFLPMAAVVNINEFPFLFAIIGQLLLLTGMAQASKGAPVLLALALSILAYWILPNFTDIAVGISVMLAALLMCMQSSLLFRSRLMITVAAVLLILSEWMREVSEAKIALILFSAMFLSIVVSIRTIVMGLGDRMSAIYQYLSWSLSGASAFGIAAVLAGFLLGQIGSDYWRTGVFSPEHYDIWHKVKDLTPSDGLIFSDFTGSNVDILHGRYYYSAVSERQMYQGGWFYGPLRSGDPAIMTERVRLNDMVLIGSISPGNLHLSRTYSSFFAVVERSRQMPKEYRALYSNPKYAIYEIPPAIL